MPAGQDESDHVDVLLAAVDAVLDASEGDEEKTDALLRIRTTIVERAQSEARVDR